MRASESGTWSLSAVNANTLIFPHGWVDTADAYVGSCVITDMALHLAGVRTNDVIQFHHAIDDSGGAAPLKGRPIRKVTVGTAVGTRGPTGELSYNPAIDNQTAAAAGLGTWSLMKEIVLTSGVAKAYRFENLNLVFPVGLIIATSLTALANNEITVSYIPWTSGFTRFRQQAGTYVPEATL